MKHSALSKICALFLCLSITFLLGGCSLTKDQVMDLLAPTKEDTENVQIETVTPTEEVETVKENILHYDQLSGDFNPLTAQSAGDWAVIHATSRSLGELGGNTVSGKANEDGTYTVTIELPGGLRYSDGESLDIDDVLFSLYVLLDESYSGSNPLSSLPVLGLQDYYRGVKESHWDKYTLLFDEVYQNGTYDEQLQKALREAQTAKPKNDWNIQQAQKALDDYDCERAEDIRLALQEVWREDASYLVDYCTSEFSASVQFHTGYTVEQLKENRGLQVMYAMVELSFGSLQQDGTLMGKKTGSTWDLKESFPTETDFYTEMFESYGGSAETYWAIEGIGRGDIVEKARLKAIQKWAQAEEDWDGGVIRIPGVVRIGDRMASITFTNASGEYTTAVSELIPAPKHIFSVAGLYDYAQASYGFPKGNVEKLPVLTGISVGTGEYKLQSYEEGKALLYAEDKDEELIITTLDNPSTQVN